ncbi:DNA repair protein RecO [Sulfurivirga sp.]|uniref:DNA repair protein RecO n=1 Tax=Sulfurivirga sp. TaxID=2614236 RepID=UPI0025F89504|nr:DNA repair protein RecO [Sulfurivirga sp.]
MLEQPAFLLHRRPYRETSLLASFITPEQGRVDLVVKGVRSTSRRARQRQAWLQPFVPLTLRWRPRPGGRLSTLYQFEAVGGGVALRHMGLLCGLYANELLQRTLTEGEPVEALFERYVRTLETLAQTAQPAQQAWALRQLEWALLEVLGSQPPLPPEGATALIWEASGWRAAVDGVPAPCVLALAEGCFEPACLAAQKRLLRQLLAPWLGGRPMESQRLLARFLERSAES